MQHTFGGGSVGEGHRLVEVSKTVTQQHRPQLEREISAGQRAARAAQDHTGAVAAGGLAGFGAGLGIAGSGKRKINRAGAAVDRARGLHQESTVRQQAAVADEHAASQARLAATRAHASAKSRQAALSQWETTGANLPHTTNIRTGSGAERAYTVTKVPSRGHSVVRNALTNELSHSGAAADKARETHDAATRATARRGEETKRFADLHARGQQVQAKIVPKMKRRIRAGRGLAAAGALVTGGALVQAERNRVNKSLTQMKGSL